MRASSAMALNAFATSWLIRGVANSYSSRNRSIDIGKTDYADIGIRKRPRQCWRQL